MTSDNFLQSIDLAPAVKAFHTLRGEISLSPYSGFNVCHYTGDSPEHVDTCRSKLAQAIGLPKSAIVIPRQTHSVNCLIIDSLPVPPQELDGVDGLVTTVRGLAIGVSTADCVPVLMTDAKAGVVGVAHAGWRGAVNGVVQNTLDAMLAKGAGVDNIVVGFAPSIGPCCFEVGEEVAECFPEHNVTRRNGFRPHVDIQGYIIDKLIERGIGRNNIIPSCECTKCHPDRYFSARALGIDSGRIFSFLYLV